MKINYNNILEGVASETGFNFEDVKTICNSFVNVIKLSLKKGYEVNILSFCKFKIGQSSKRNRYNFTEESVKLAPERMVPKCEFVRKFRNEINKQA